MNVRHALFWGSKRRRASYWMAAVNDGDGSALITLTADLTVKRYNMINGGEYPLAYTLLARDSIMERLGVSGELHSAAISPDGRFVFGSLVHIHSGDVRIWDLSSGALVGRLHGHSQRAESFAFVADGSMLATGGFDHTAHSWDLTPLCAKTTPQPSEQTPEGPEEYQYSIDPKVTFTEHRVRSSLTMANSNRVLNYTPRKPGLGRRNSHFPRREVGCVRLAQPRRPRRAALGSSYRKD